MCQISFQSGQVSAWYAKNILIIFAQDPGFIYFASKYFTRILRFRLIKTRFRVGLTKYHPIGEKIGEILVSFVCTINSTEQQRRSVYRVLNILYSYYIFGKIK